MRIVGGDLRGRRLATPKTDATRPTTDRNREMLFNILAHAYAEQLRGDVLDLFAGTGALGCEALSRGARSCAFVENTAAARALLHENIENLGLAARTRILRRDATKPGSRDSLPAATLVFADPPYNQSLGEKALASALAGGWLKPGCLCILEESADAVIDPPAGFELLETRVMGHSALHFFELN